MTDQENGTEDTPTGDPANPADGSQTQAPPEVNEPDDEGPKDDAA